MCVPPPPPPSNSPPLYLAPLYLPPRRPIQPPIVGALESVARFARPSRAGLATQFAHQLAGRSSLATSNLKLERAERGHSRATTPAAKSGSPWRRHSVWPRSRPRLGWPLELPAVTGNSCLGRRMEVSNYPVTSAMRRPIKLCASAESCSPGSRRHRTGELNKQAVQLRRP